jgi:hypothetical protein
MSIHCAGSFVWGDSWTHSINLTGSILAQNSCYDGLI